MRLALGVLGLLMALVGCHEDNESFDGWPPDLVPCDAREAPCVARLARGLAALHGVPWPDDIAVEVHAVGGSNPPTPFPWWWAEVGTAPSPFDVLDSTAPPIVRPAGSVWLFGDRRLVFRVDPRVEADAAARHRVGLIRALGPHLRARARPGNAIDTYGSFPTRTMLRSGVRTAQALMIERAIQRRADGEPPWRFSKREIDKARMLRAEQGGPELVALDRLYALHDPDDPWALLYGVPDAIGDGCLIGFDLDAPERCVQVEPAVAGDVVDGFVARSADAADGVLLEEALREADHPAADLALTLRAHLGRDYNRDDGAGVRRDTFVFFDPAAAEAFAGALAEGLDGDARWTADGDDRWRFEGDDETPAGGEARLAVDGVEVVLVAATDGVDATAFLEDAGVIVEPLYDVKVQPDIPCDAGGAELPCDVRAACCRERLVAEAEALLGPLPEVWMRVLDPESAVQLYLGPQWADDRLGSQNTAAVRFATGIDHSLRESNDAADEEHARRVLAWYYGTLRSVVMVVPEGPRDTDALLRENTTVVHELVHAWQDARYGINAIRLQARAVSSDAEAALLTLTEGTAEMVSEAFAVRASGGAVDDVDWGAWADEIAGLIAPAVDRAEEPARTHAAWLPYVGGLVTAAHAFESTGDLAAVGDRVDTPPGSTAAVLGELYGAASAEPDPGALPAARFPGTLPLPGAVLAHRGFVGGWPLALRLAPHLGGPEAIDAVLGLVSAREVVVTHAMGHLTWIDVAVAFGDEEMAAGLDGLGLAIAERLGGTHRIARAPGRITLVIGPDDAMVQTMFDAIE